jgi:hypothetical protein
MSYLVNPFLVFSLRRVSEASRAVFAAATFCAFKRFIFVPQ